MIKIKLKFMILLFLAAPFAKADSVNWRIGKVEGRIETLGDLQLEKAQAVASCHYCKLSTCAGGPTVETSMPTRLTKVNATQYQVTIEAGVHKSRFPFKALHSCSYGIYFAGTRGEAGVKVTGSVLLATSLKNAANPIFMDEMLSEGLTEAMEEPLELEIVKQGLLDPAILNQNQTPYFSGK